MKSIAVHSQKGGVGKTTLSLLLAKHMALSDSEVCVLDFDFLGSGMANLFAMDPPAQYVESYFEDGNPHDYDVERLLGTYTDRQLGSRRVSVVLNVGRGMPTAAAAREEKRLEDDMMGRAANEPHYRSVHTWTGILLPLLADQGLDFAVLDCHPGLGLVSDAVRDLVDLNIYVTTPNRSDCFGLLRAANLRGLDRPNSLLVVNKAEAPVLDRPSLVDTMGDDSVIGPAGSGLLSQLKYLAVHDRHALFVTESDELRRSFSVGSSGHVPAIDPGASAHAFLRGIDSLLRNPS